MLGRGREYKNKSASLGRKAGLLYVKSSNWTKEKENGSGLHDRSPSPHIFSASHAPIFGSAGSERCRSLAGRWTRFVTDRTLLPSGSGSGMRP